MPTNHLEVWAYESASCDETPIERQLGKIKQLMGGHLDGTQNIDGYSIDGAYALLKAGMSPAAIARWFKSDKPTWDQVCARAEAV